MLPVALTNSGTWVYYCAQHVLHCAAHRARVWHVTNTRQQNGASCIYECSSLSGQEATPWLASAHISQQYNKAANIKQSPRVKLSVANIRPRKHHSVHTSQCCPTKDLSTYIHTQSVLSLVIWHADKCVCNFNLAVPCTCLMFCNTPKKTGRHRQCQHHPK